jgi:hypothetical protein
MSGKRNVRQEASGPLDPKLGRMVALSLVLHLVLVVVFSGVILPRVHTPPRPVYFVDLMNLPVERPQAGRPDAPPEPVKVVPPPEPARPKPSAPAPSPEPIRPQPAAPVTPPVKPRPVPLKTVPAKPKAPVKPAPVPAKPAPKPSGSVADPNSAIEQMRLRQKIAELTAKDTRQTPSAAPVGMPDGQGDQAGVDQRTWLNAFFKANWSLSRYQVTNRNLQARVTVRYDAEGNLLDYRFLDASGDQAFDDSVKRAILKEKKLPFSPKRRLEEEVVFNLKDLME